MTWSKLADNFHSHPKALRMGLDGCGLYARALSYSGCYLTDGFLPESWAALQAPPEILERLVDVGAWKQVAGGFEIVDFLDYNPSRADVESERESTRKRVSRWRESNGKSNAVTTPDERSSYKDPVPEPVKPPVPNGTSPTAAVLEVYDHWRHARRKSRSTYDRISQQRRRKIEARLREFSADELKHAIDCVALDTWEERSRHDDITIIFRNREQVEKFLDLADLATSTQLVVANGNGAKRYGRGLTSEDALALTKEALP